MKPLEMPCRTSACMKALVRGSWEVLVSRSCKIRAFYDALESFS